MLGINKTISSEETEHAKLLRDERAQSIWIKGSIKKPSTGVHADYAGFVESLRYFLFLFFKLIFIRV